MAFNAQQFDATGSGSKGAVKMATYSETSAAGDALATIAASGYFNAQSDNINTGDFILVYSARATGGGAALYQMVNTAGVITVGLTSTFA